MVVSDTLLLMSLQETYHQVQVRVKVHFYHFQVHQVSQTLCIYRKIPVPYYAKISRPLTQF